MIVNIFNAQEGSEMNNFALLSTGCMPANLDMLVRDTFFHDVFICSLRNTLLSPEKSAPDSSQRQSKNVGK